MSTKIYKAYRLKEGHDLWETLHRIRKKAEKSIDKVLRELAAGLLEASEKNEKLKRLILDMSGHKDAALDKTLDLDDVFYYMGQQYKEQQTKTQRDAFDFNVSVGVWHHDGRYLFIPYCDCFMKRALDFMSRDKSLEDYSYWNNTDKPRNISEKRWVERGKVWDVLTEPDVWKTNLVLEILTPQNYYMFNFWLHDQLEASAKRMKRREKAKANRKKKKEVRNER